MLGVAADRGSIRSVRDVVHLVHQTNTKALHGSDAPFGDSCSLSAHYAPTPTNN
jgi:hypothetical protein